MRISDLSSDVCSSDLLAYTAGEAIGPDIFDFFRALGINLTQLYGQTECTVYLCLQTDADVRSDTGGPSSPLFAHSFVDARIMRSEARRVGNSVSVRVDLGGRRIIKKKHHHQKH